MNNGKNADRVRVNLVGDDVVITGNHKLACAPDATHPTDKRIPRELCRAFADRARNGMSRSPVVLRNMLSDFE